MRVNEGGGDINSAPGSGARTHTPIATVRYRKDRSLVQDFHLESVTENLRDKLVHKRSEVDGRRIGQGYG